MYFKIFSFRDGKKLEDSKKYTKRIIQNFSGIYLTINNLTVFDTANYTLVGSNQYDTDNFTYDVKVAGNVLQDCEELYNIKI